jgi:hypothetical protein
MGLRKILNNLKEFAEIRKRPLIIGGAVLALLAVDTVLHYSGTRDSNPTMSRQSSGLEFYRGTPDGDNLCEGTPDRTVMEMTRNCPTLSPDRIVDFCSWYKREYGNWSKWDDATCRAYSEEAWKRFIENRETHSKG